MTQDPFFLEDYEVALTATNLCSGLFKGSAELCGQSHPRARYSTLEQRPAGPSSSRPLIQARAACLSRAKTDQLDTNAPKASWETCAVRAQCHQSNKPRGKRLNLSRFPHYSQTQRPLVLHDWPHSEKRKRLCAERIISYPSQALPGGRAENC